MTSISMKGVVLYFVLCIILSNSCIRQGVTASLLSVKQVGRRCLYMLGLPKDGQCTHDQLCDSINAVCPDNGKSESNLLVDILTQDTDYRKKNAQVAILEGNIHCMNMFYQPKTGDSECLDPCMAVIELCLGRSATQLFGLMQRFKAENEGLKKSLLQQLSRIDELETQKHVSNIQHTMELQECIDQLQSCNSDVNITRELVVEQRGLLTKGQRIKHTLESLLSERQAEIQTLHSDNERCFAEVKELNNTCQDLKTDQTSSIQESQEGEDLNG
ncbi:uncharacterized protein LOC144445820 [Glandiceps talaboti]